MKHHLTFDTCCQIEVLDELVVDTFEAKHPADPYEACIARLESTKSEYQL